MGHSAGRADRAAHGARLGATDGPRARRARERREHLLDVALDLFSQRGAEQATIKDLAAAAGVAQGLIYHYFASKEDLLRALVEERGFLPRIREVLARPTDRPAADTLPEIARGIYEVFQEKRQLVRVIWHEALTHPEIREGLSRLQMEGHHQLARYLAARVEAGELRPHDSESAARSLLSTIVMAILFDTAPEPLLGSIVANLLDGIRRPRAPRGGARGTRHQEG